VNEDFIAGITNAWFYNHATDAGLEKILLELAVAGTPVDDDQKTVLRAAVGVGVTEALMQLGEVIRIAMEQGE
jgi:hypothetical protein